MKCKKAIRQLPAYLDGELTESERAEVDRHLEVCLFCSTQLSALRRTSTMLDSWGAIFPRRSRVPDVVGQIQAEKEGAFDAHKTLWNYGVTGFAVRAAAAVVFLAGSVVFSSYFTGEKGAEKISAGVAGERPSGGSLVALDEDVRQNYIKPTEFWLVLRGMEERSRSRQQPGYPWDDLLRHVTSEGISGNSVRPTVVDHVYYPGEGMPVEFIMPVGGP